MKRIIACLVVFTVIASISAAGEQITKIAVVDLSRIYSSYFSESQAVRELENMRGNFQERIDSIKEEIQSLESEKLEAQNAGNEDRALRLDDQIFQKKQYLKEFVRIKNNQLQKQRQKLSESSDFLDEVLKQISYVSERNGYSLVLKASDQNLVWWNSEVDITDKVLERLLSRSND